MKCDTCPSDAVQLVGESNERLACAKCADAFIDECNSIDIDNCAVHGWGAMPPVCSAHGVAKCCACSRISSEHLTDGGDCRSCDTYGLTGMHWDTCSRRIRGTIFATRDEAGDFA